jgi:hypothetical protein
MPDLPLLLPSQKSLIIDLVEADACVPPNKRMHFIAYHWPSSKEETALISHPGLKNGNRNIFLGDLTVLAQKGLIQLSGSSDKSYQVTILPDLYLHYGFIKQPILPEARAAVREVLTTTLTNAQRALRVLELRAARYGETLIPSYLALDLDDKRVEIVDLEQHIQQLDLENDTAES